MASDRGGGVASIDPFASFFPSVFEGTLGASEELRHETPFQSMMGARGRDREACAPTPLVTRRARVVGEAREPSQK